MTMAEGGTMTGTGYTLVIGDKNYSSWSLRPWLALKACGAAFEEERIRLRGVRVEERLALLRLLERPEGARELRERIELLKRKMATAASNVRRALR